MIQRIQTVFLLLVVACNITALFVPLVYFKVDEQVHIMTAFSTVEVEGAVTTSALWVGIVLMGIIAVASFSIFQYKNRLLQMKLGALISLLTAVSVGLIWFIKGEAPTQMGIGMWLILGSLVFNFLANWFIRRDEKLVRDSNRLR